MQKLVCLTLPLLAVLLTSCNSVPENPANTVDLFNGKDLNNWRAVLVNPEVKKEEVWSVQNGLLVCKGEPLGYLATDQSFADFKLIVEWRWAPGKEPGNSGVLMRINGEPKGLPRCIEAQLKSGDAGDLYGFHGMKIDGAAARRKEVKGHQLGGDLVGVKKITGAEKPPGEWNRYEIQLQGGNLKVWINGKKVNEATDCEMAAGPVALQSEGGEIHFRAVRLAPLD